MPQNSLKKCIICSKKNSFFCIDKNKELSPEINQLFKVLERKTECSTQLFMNYIGNVSESQIMSTPAIYNFFDFIRINFSVLVDLLQKIQIDTITYIKLNKNLQRYIQRTEFKIKKYLRNEKYNLPLEQYRIKNEVLQESTYQRKILLAEIQIWLKKQIDKINLFKKHV